MSDVPRRAWATAIRTDATWPTGSRVVRGTLLALTAEMRPDGVIRHRPRDVLAARVGLPERTLRRHLARAVELGWLTHRRAHRHVVAEYRAVIPTRLSGPEVAPIEPVYAGHTLVPIEPVYAGHLVAHSIDRERARMREHVALDEGRERRAEHDGTRAEPDHNDNSSSSNEHRADDHLHVGAAVDPGPARTRHPNPDDPHGGQGFVTRARDAEDPRSLTRPLAGAALHRWEPTRPIGPIVVYGVTYDAGRRVREAVA